MTAELDIAAWCARTAEHHRDMEEHELALYPSPDARDAAIVEWTVRVLGNPKLPESAAVVAALAAQHGAASEIADLTRERDEALAEVAQWEATYGKGAHLPGALNPLKRARRERDEARAERDQLAAALDRAASVRVDTRDVIWHPADAGRWRHPLYGTLDLDQIEAEYGRTRAALLVAIDDDVQLTPAPDPIAVLDAEAEARRTIAAELDRVAASDRLTAVWLERHGLGGQLAPPVPTILAALALDITAGEVHGRRERWVVVDGVGGYVCAEPGDGPDGICGMPVEDVPCTVHHPADGGQP